ncbi:MAG: hypothetical protein KA100_00025 [Rickettsiales bacterium]|nr:hypothetical protein [Rickettsiales bacterium]
MQITLNNYENLLAQIKATIAQAQQNIVQIVNREKVVMSWQIGKMVEEHLLKNNSTGYGEHLIKQLEKDTAITKRALYQMRSFYKSYPELPKKENDLSWSHYRALASLQSEEKRKILEDLTIKNNLKANELQQAIAKENKAAKKKTRKKVEQKKITKFSVTRGQLFTYKIKVFEDSPQSFVDLGFNMFCEIETKLKDGEIVESKKSGDKFLLKKSTTKSTKMHTYKARLERVVDGDTIHVILDLGFKMQHRENLRLAKINAAEIESDEGQKAFEALKKILKSAPFLIVKTNKTDIYGRYIADVFFSETGEGDLQKVADSGVYLSQRLLDLGVVEVF